jgi:hypothetical protein
MHILKKALLTAAVCATFAGPASAQSFGFATFHALVTAQGVAARAAGVQAVTRPSIGRYRVQFTRQVNINACVFAATPFGASGGQASTQPVPGQPDTVAVFTFSRTGVPANIPFSLVVSCS